MWGDVLRGRCCEGYNRTESNSWGMVLGARPTVVLGGSAEAISVLNGLIDTVEKEKRS